MGACFGSSSVCTEQYSVWAPTSAPGSASATLPARLLVTSIEPTRQTPNSPAREGSFKQKVPKFGPEQNSPPAGFGSKSARLAQEHNLRVFSHNFVSEATLVVR